MKAKLLRARLVAQAKDEIDMGDYKKQISAYQHIINDQLLLLIELAELVETALAPPTDHLPLN
jgi:hypothetical protein